MDAPTVDLNTLNWPREAHNFLMQRKAGNYQVDEVNVLNDYLNHMLQSAQNPRPKFKVGLMFVAINPPYWQYAKQVIDGVRHFFLPGHETEIMLFTDMQKYPESKDTNFGATVFPVDTIEWPYPTLMRYQIFLKQEEYLKKFDYLFYLDLDMRIVGIVGDEIFGEGLTMAQHPMYALQQPFWFPFEPNEDSAAHIKQPGRVVEKNGKKMFQPLYAAGGFQGGKTEAFIEAMKAIQVGIDSDLAKGYIARWNDESHWNKYLFDHPPSVVLDASYIYPDSMIENYYKKIWGRDFVPRIITLTKPFTTSKEGGEAAAELIRNV